MAGPGFIPTFLYYFVGMTFIAVFVISQGAENGLELGNPWQVAIVFGLVSGLAGGYVNSHKTIALPIKNKGAFLKTLKDTLTAMGYAETSQVDEFTVYERSGLSKFLSGKLFVQLEKETATVSGRSTQINTLQKQLENR